MTAATGYFVPGTFTPASGAVPIARAVTRLSWLEFKLFARNGEQLVVNLIIPVTTLLMITLLPVGGLGTHRTSIAVPAVMAGAIISSAFTGQAIAVAFDRRYGALKRIGATIAPRWAIIVSKSIAVSAVIAVQLAVLGGIGLLIDWSPQATQLFNMTVVAIVGACCFSAMGLLLGGSLRAELVLPIANILWLIQLGIIILAVLTPTSKAAAALAEYSAAGALATGMTSSSVDAQIHSTLVLATWCVSAGWLAKRYFRFT